MSKFKIGDKVRKYTGDDWCGARVGHVGTVTGFGFDGSLQLDGRDAVYHSQKYFELVTPTWQPKQGEMVEVMRQTSGWVEREFFAMDGDLFVCRSGGVSTEFYSWPYCRPLKRLVTFGDGQEVYIDRATEERWKREAKEMK